MACASLGLHVLLTEETSWVGGQLTSQSVPPDEHKWIEQFGCTARYRMYRDGVRNYYRKNYPLTEEARRQCRLNPGGGYVSRICHEPKVGLAVLQEMLAYYESSQRLKILLRHRPIAASSAGDKIRDVTFQNLETGTEVTYAADYILDATELGDLLPLAGVEYVSGAESQRDTGELHAVDGPAQPDNVQGFTWCFPMGFDPDGEHVIDKPAQYDFWRSYQPSLTPSWPMPLFGWDFLLPQSMERSTRVMMPWEGTPDQSKWSFWLYRRIVCRDHYAAGAMPQEVTLVNWHMNDYWEGNVIDAGEELRTARLENSRQMSLSLLYWLQTEAPRPDGDTGYPGFCLRPDLTGTADGLAMAPYFRESRRIKAVFTVTEAHIGTEMRLGRNVYSSEHYDYGGERPEDLAGKVAAEPFHDSVGVGSYRIDLHPSTSGANYIDVSSLPYQIPLGALLPVRMRNLLPACKNLGVTHITNGCFRLHPAEWNIGESAGLLAGFCLLKNVEPHQVREKPELLADFQKLLREQGVELEWPATHPV